MAKNTIWTINGDGGNTARQVKELLANVANVHERMHMVARNAMIQVLVHSQSTPLVELLTGLSGTSVHVVGLKDWAIKHGRGITIGLDAAKKIKVHFPKDFKQMTLDEAIEWAMLVPSFWNENPPPSLFKGFNYEAELAKLNKKAEEMARALLEGTIKKGGEVIELTPEQLKQINLKGYRGAMGAQPAATTTHIEAEAAA